MPGLHPTGVGLDIVGFGLDSFMMRYQGVDWLDQGNWKCNKQCVSS